MVGNTEAIRVRRADRTPGFCVPRRGQGTAAPCPAAPSSVHGKSKGQRRFAPMVFTSRLDWGSASLRNAVQLGRNFSQARSVILTSRTPVTRWHEQIGDLTLLNGILDRLVYNAHRIEMRRFHAQRSGRQAAGLSPKLLIDATRRHAGCIATPEPHTCSEQPLIVVLQTQMRNQVFSPHPAQRVLQLH